MTTAAEAAEMTELQKPDTEARKIEEGETTQSSDPDLAVTNDEKREEEPEEELPPLTYIDFLPQCFGTRMEGSDPIYSAFQTVVEQANQWLLTSSQFSVVKCQTVDYKLNPADFRVEPDFCLQHFSSHGRNIYIRGLRLWLMPRRDPSLPIQQLGYVTVLPDHSSCNLMTALSTIQPAAMRTCPEQLFKEFDTLKVTVEKLNHHLQQKPLPGRILTVETLCLKTVESDCKIKFNTEDTLWAESGKGTRLFLFATRIFYVVGPAAFEKICYYDGEPDTVQYPEDFGLRIKFAPFSQTVAQVAAWLTTQTNMRSVNFQSLTLKMERPGGVGPFKMNPEGVGFIESQGLQESRYVKILRVFYVRDPQRAGARASPQSSSFAAAAASSSSSATAAEAAPPALYKSVHLTSRLFVPTRGASDRSFETFSKTMQRVITWLKATGTPVLGMEAVGYPVNLDSDQGVSSERVDCVVNAYAGQYSLTCIRLYFPCQFKEPPPEAVPETEEDYWGWACVLS